LDLGLTTTPLLLTKNEVQFPDGQKLNLKQLKKIQKNEQKCYFVGDNDIQPVNVFSEQTGWMRTLYPTKSAPTTLVSGFLMHRIKNTNPLEDTEGKVAALGTIQGGEILDTCFGLGYTAMELAKSGKVTTVEIDPGALEIAQINPYSSPLFLNPEIEVIVGDIREVVKDFSDDQFSYILHDPPSFRIADELYDSVFYEDLYRVLKNKGVLFHYIGDPESPLGMRVTRGVIERLKDVGFFRIEQKKEVFGVVAIK
jgi:predicted methyltransferase